MPQQRLIIEIVSEKVQKGLANEGNLLQDLKAKRWQLQVTTPRVPPCGGKAMAKRFISLDLNSRGSDCDELKSLFIERSWDSRLKRLSHGTVVVEECVKHEKWVKSAVARDFCCINVVPDINEKKLLQPQESDPSERKDKDQKDAKTQRTRMIFLSIRPRMTHGMFPPANTNDVPHGWSFKTVTVSSSSKANRYALRLAFQRLQTSKVSKWSNDLPPTDPSLQAFDVFLFIPGSSNSRHCSHSTIIPENTY
jgi:hypothetical protein